MASNRQYVWLITGASSTLGYRLCLSALARGDLVIASAASPQDVERLRTAGAYGIKMDSEMSFGQIKSKIHEAVSYYGRVDFLINNPHLQPHRLSSAADLSSSYETNTFSYSAIQVTKAVALESPIRQIVVVAPGDQPVQSQQSTYSDEMSDNVEATAQLLASEYRSRRVRVLLVNPRGVFPGPGSRYAPGDTRLVVERIVVKMVEGGSSEPGIRVL